jgi:hypothetical protein
MSDTPPPPGWYGDPAGAHGSRWWDGSAWTDHVRGAPPGNDPPPPPDGTAATGSLPLSGGGRRVGVAVLAVLAVGLAATTVVGVRVGSGTATGPDGAVLGEVRPGAEVPAPLDPDDVRDRTSAAGCEVTVDGRPLEDRSHLDAAEAPPPDALYPERPAHSGRHYGTLLPLPVGAATVPLDERAVLHNMEHGSVVVWFADDLPLDERRAVATWRDERADLGFTSPAGGAVFASPMPADITDPPAVAMRAWGVALDCERFDPVVADAFLVDHWGSHGAAPERDLSPYPDESLEILERA